MGHIKLKFSNLAIAIFLLISLFFVILTNINTVKGSGAAVSIIGEPTYRLTNTVMRDDKVIGKTYEINITIRNNGNGRSDELVVNLTDIEGFSLSKRITLEPGETKIVSFTWATMTIKNQAMRISFYPSNPDITWNEYNSGSKTFTIHVNDETGVPAASTPGFEFIFVITTIAIFVFLRKKETKFE